MVVKRRKEEQINEAAKAGRIQRADEYKYLGIMISPERHLTKHIKEPTKRCDIIHREISVIGEKHK